MTDITFNLAGTTINLRVGAIIRSPHKVLICRLPGADWWYVPGGRIAVGESSLEALNREIGEEIEGAWEIRQPIASSENFFDHDGDLYHEHCIYYDVVWASSDETVTSLSHEEFRWVSRDELESYDLRPAFVKSLLSQNGAQMRHIIHHEVQHGGAAE